MNKFWKPIFMAALFAALLCTSACVKSDSDRLVGTWKSEDEVGMKGGIILNSDGSASLLAGSATTEGTWTVSEARQDGTFDLDFISIDNGAPNRRPFLAKMIGNDQMWIRMEPGFRSRPVEFTKDTRDENQMILERAK